MIEKCEGCGEESADLKADAGDNILCPGCRQLKEETEIGNPPPPPPPPGQPQPKQPVPATDKPKHTPRGPKKHHKPRDGESEDA